MVTVVTTATVAPAVGEVIVEVGGTLSGVGVGVGVGLAGVLGRLVIPQPAVSVSKVTTASPVISLNALT